MKKLLILTLLMASSVWALPFKLAGTIYEFKAQEGLLLKGCEKGCDALKTIKKHSKINLTQVRKGLKQANSVGSDVCNHVYQGKSVLGVAENQDRHAFCLFKDQSMVELNSLDEYLVKMKVISE